MAWATEISQRAGVEVPLYDYTAGFNVQPKPFVFDLKPRSEARQRLVETTWEMGRERDPMGDK